MYKYRFSLASRINLRTFSLLKRPSDSTITNGQFIAVELFYMSSNLFASDTKFAIAVSADVLPQCLKSNELTI